MHTIVHVLSILLVSIGMGLAVAHALECPGKRRLSRDQYFAVQQIYHPGFTIGGLAEVAGLLATLWLLVITPVVSVAFWLIAGAFSALLLAHAVYWSVNRSWLEDRNIGAAGAAFLSGGAPIGSGDWEALRDRWERSHIARAILMFIGFAMLAVALSESAALTSDWFNTPGQAMRAFDAKFTPL
jgi:hypothetical protein